MAGKAEGAQTAHTAERWRQILEIVDAAYADYLTGMAALRKRVVGDVKRKLKRRRASRLSPSGTVVTT